MSLKIFRQNILLASLLLVLFLIMRRTLPLFTLAAIFWIFASRADFRLALFLCALCLFLLAEPYETNMPHSDTFRIAEIHQNYAVAESGRCRIMLYTNGPVPLDTTIRLKPVFQKIEHHKSFFGFDFAAYIQRNGVFYQSAADGYEIIDESPTLRRCVQKKTDEIEDPLLRAFVYRVLFNCTDASFLSGSFLIQGGFSLAGVMIIMEALLQYFLDERKRAKTMIGVNIALILLYGFQMIPISSLIRRVLKILDLNRAERCGFWSILMTLLFRDQIFSAAFLIPLCFSLSSLYEEDRIWIRYSLLFSVQSILFQRVNLFDTLFYPFLIKIYGLLWFYGTACVFFPFLRCTSLILFLSRFSLITEKLCIHGSMLGAGLPFFIIWIVSFYRNEHFWKILSGSLIVFMICGLFHPFAEVCFVNVGQGDCILIKGPFLIDNILIDTGRPGQYGHVQAALNARGIRRLNTLFITHMDSDHCGNMEAIKEEYRPLQVITDHQGTTCSSLFVFHDLNSIVSEDRNQSSIVLAFGMNNLDFLMCGDADMIAEERIANRFPDLKCDVLKLCHHGSKTGSCDRFLDVVKPSLGVISSGAYSIYHHPSPETVQRLMKRHIPYLSTRQHGDLSILMIGPLRLLITSDGYVDLL